MTFGNFRLIIRRVCEKVLVCDNCLDYQKWEHQTIFHATNLE